MFHDISGDDLKALARDCVCITLPRDEARLLIADYPVMSEPLLCAFDHAQATAKPDKPVFVVLKITG
jgi:hypothetical protein